jgi:dolichol-phosphate mannosyltransferase
MDYHITLPSNDGNGRGEGHRHADFGGAAELTDLPTEAARKHPTVSIITPAHREQDNLPILHDRLVRVLDGLGVTWEWIIVDDHSPDGTYSVIEALSRRNPSVRGLRLSRNFGSHIGIACGLDQARGGCAIIMAADLQDPPEAIPGLLQQWQAGSQIVWAVRSSRQGEALSTLTFAKLYYWMMRRVVGLSAMPATGADFFLLDRVVIEAARTVKERNASLFALLTWMGFRSTSIEYDKPARLHGSSSWTLRKKLRLVVDSFTSFSHKPIQWMTWFGFATAALGFIYAAIVICNAFAGSPIEGWSSLMVAVLILGGCQMLMLGVIGEYLWRALDEARQRPRYLIESVTPPAE